MGVSLIWTRKVEARDTFDTGLKHVLERRFQPPATLTGSDCSYLQGLADANEKWRPQLKELIEAIRRFDEVILEYR
jgi:hypothetical protein